MAIEARKPAAPAQDPASATPVAAKPAEAKPAEAKPADAKPAAAKPAEAKPAEAKKPAAKSTDKPAAKKPAPARKPAAAPVTVAAGPDALPPPRPQKMRRRLLKLSFVLMVIGPVSAGTYYFGWIASDRYAAEAGFSVRAIEQSAGLDGLGALTGLAASGSTTSESYIVLEYLESRALVEALQTDLDLRTAFSDPSIDFLYRMEADVPAEEFVDYWRGMITTSFNTSSSIVNFEVEAFDPATARTIADRVLFHVRELVNALSAQAREDALRFASREVGLAEQRLRDALADIRDFRDAERSIDPAATAQLDIALLSSLEEKLLEIRARMAAIAGRVAADSPSMVSLRSQAEALEAQIAERTEAVADASGRGGTEGGQGGGMSSLLATYETLEVEKRFAEQAYASALASLEQARIEAGRQQRYLAVFNAPETPDAAIYPERALNAILLTLGALGFWGVATLMVYSVRDHMT